MSRLIYLDNAATTAMRAEVLDAMLPYFRECYGNPAGIYSLAGEARAAVDKARQAVAALIGAQPNEIYFTSGGSEADNWALKAAALTNKAKGNHIITSAVEHHAVLNTCHYLEQQGYEVSYIGVDADGIIKLDELAKAIRPTTVLISIMTANNEIGSLQPISAIGKLAREQGILFHTDAVQAYGHEPLDVKELNIDMLSASGHKLGGPKGIGFLYVRSGVQFMPLLHGGSQENGRRAGTHNVPAIVGMGKAAELAAKSLAADKRQLTELRDYLIAKVLREIPYSRLTGHPTKRLANNASFCFSFIEGESLLMLLNQKHICASSGSACTSGSLEPSHVLLALGIDHATAHGSLRLSLSPAITKADIDYTVAAIKDAVARLRSMSPLYEDFIQKNA